MGVRGSNDEAGDYARIDREALELLKDAGPVKGVGVIALHMAQEVALASRPRKLNHIDIARDRLRRFRVRWEDGFPWRHNDGVDAAMLPAEGLLIDKLEALPRELEEASRKPGRECSDPRGHVWTADGQCKFCDLTREQAGALNRKPGRLANLDLRGL